MKLLLVATALFVRSVVGNTIVTPWITDHHDNHNTGWSSILYNSTQFNGTCVSVATSPLPGAYFTTSGATSSDAKNVYVVSSANGFQIVSTSGIMTNSVSLGNTGGMFVRTAAVCKSWTWLALDVPVAQPCSTRASCCTLCVSCPPGCTCSAAAWAWG